MGSTAASEDPLGAQLAAVGLSPALAESLIPRREQAYAIGADIWDAVRLFVAAGTQWRRDAGQLVGMAYGDVRATAEWLGIATTPRLLEDLRVMEAEVLARAERRRR